MKFTIPALLLALGLAVFTVGCDSGSKATPPKDKQSQAETNKSVAVNTVCPIMGNDVDPDAVTVQFKGQTIGFCCDDCDEKWAKLTDKEKEEKLAEAKKKAEAKS